MLLSTIVSGDASASSTATATPAPRRALLSLARAILATGERPDPGEDLWVLLSRDGAGATAWTIARTPTSAAWVRVPWSGDPAHLARALRLALEEARIARAALERRDRLEDALAARDEAHARRELREERRRRRVRERVEELVRAAV